MHLHNCWRSVKFACGSRSSCEKIDSDLNPAKKISQVGLFSFYLVARPLPNDRAGERFLTIWENFYCVSVKIPNMVGEKMREKTFQRVWGDWYFQKIYIPVSVFSPLYLPWPRSRLKIWEEQWSFSIVRRVMKLSTFSLLSLSMAYRYRLVSHP